MTDEAPVKVIVKMSDGSTRSFSGEGWKVKASANWLTVGNTEAVYTYPTAAVLEVQEAL